MGLHLTGKELLRLANFFTHKRILGPALFNRFISDLDAAVECIISKFVGDTKLGGAADSCEGWEAFQRDPNK